MNDATKNDLDALPMVSLRWPCATCGYNGEFVACNIDETGQVTDCAKCASRKN